MYTRSRTVAMAAMVTVDKAPITKGILCCMFITSCAIHVPLLSQLRYYFVYNCNEILSPNYFYLWRIVTAKLAFLDMKDLVCGSLLLYYFRVFERRLGSHRFSVCVRSTQHSKFISRFLFFSIRQSYLFANFIIATSFELITVSVLKHFNVSGLEYLPSGPFSIIFPLFINYLLDIPKVTQTHILGIPVTGKSLTYVLGLQVLSSSRGSLICSVCGLLAGIICRFNVLNVCNYLKIPKSVATVCEKLFAWLLASNPPEGENLMGATLEIQRQQQIELIEQQMMISRARQLRERTINRRSAESVLEPTPSTSSGDVSHENNGSITTTEEKIQTLVEMGFERQKVIEALVRTNNDINLATSVLLSEG
ncbi:Ubiquitin-associated domain-containing protein 2-like protein [Dinothrombium tinctorium]|uniref:Ubiquitin-associated domain-containing protein 2-like protein n=1 Tax=Dinothrombium tinctorium TaxID=1965070 RepID=A0A3S3SG11_9ACAR|nr:Ubiquitin-associated domain-containing protein 2-like protein [Dinothrombium tinctorium]